MLTIDKQTDNEERTSFVFSNTALADKFDPNAEFEILTTALQTDERYGDFRYTQAQLEEMAKNFNDDIVGTEIAVDMNHARDGVALAWMVAGSMYVAPSKKLAGEHSIYVKLHRFTPEGEKMLSTGALRYFSVELQVKFTKFVNGAKKVFKNVLRGLALTNRPVIKDMQPTFSENHNPIHMNDRKKLEEAEAAKKAEEAKQAEEAAAAEAKANEDAEAKKTEEEEVAKADDEDAAPDAAALAEAVAKKLSEAKGVSAADIEKTVKDLLQPTMTKFNEAFTVLRDKRLSQEVETLCLSDDKGVGIKADSKADVLAFVKTLSNKQSEAYFKLHEGLFVTVDLTEHGSGDAGVVQSGDAVADLHKKATELSEGSEGKLSYREASDKILSEDSELAKLVLAEEAKQ